MAILLIYDHDNTHVDPLKDQRGCYKRGMIVEVLDDSKHDGDLVRNPIMPPWILVNETEFGDFGQNVVPIIEVTA